MDRSALQGDAKRIHSPISFFTSFLPLYPVHFPSFSFLFSLPPSRSCIPVKQAL